MRLSNSKVNTWRRCPRKYKFKYIQRLEPKVKGLPLTRGDWLHQMLMSHYDGEGWKPKHQELTKQFNNMFEEEREEYGDLPGETARIMRSYRRRWKDEDQRYVVVDSELDEILQLPNSDNSFNFIIDLIVEDVVDGGLWLWDHKTVSKFMPPDFMLLDTQLTRYYWSAERMGYKPLRGVMFNEIRTKPPAVPALLKSGGLSRRKNIDTDFYTYLGEIRKYDLDPANYAEILSRLKRNTGSFFRRTRLPKDKPVYKRQMGELLESAEEMEAAQRRDRYPRTATKTCLWDCEYKDICIAELMGADIEPMIKMGFKRRKRMVDKRGT